MRTPKALEIQASREPAFLSCINLSITVANIDIGCQINNGAKPHIVV